MFCSSLQEEETEEEDLAALHAEMLKATTSAATANDNVSGVAGKGKLTVGDGRGGRSRNSGRIGVGDEVEGRFEAGTEWFPAIVTKVRRAKGVRVFKRYQVIVVQHHDVVDSAEVWVVLYLLPKNVNVNCPTSTAVGFR